MNILSPLLLLTRKAPDVVMLLSHPLEPRLHPSHDHLQCQHSEQRRLALVRIKRVTGHNFDQLPDDVRLGRARYFGLDYDQDH